MEEIKCEQVGQIVGSGFTEMTGRVYSADGLTPSIRTFAGGNTEVKIAEPIAYDEQNGYLRQDGCVGTLTTDGSSPKHNNRVVEPNEQDYRIRKLTEQEAFRLMGVKNDDFENVSKNQSMSSLYHLAGDSIVTTCLMAIFGQLFSVNDYANKIEQLTKQLSVEAENSFIDTDFDNWVYDDEEDYE